MRHAHLTCRNHLRLRWLAKEIAVTRRDDGSVYYNGCRGIHYISDERECDCKADQLIEAVDGGQWF